ncbi:MAG TPA: LysM peptidoglycan-binding domain-containing protein [Candidatus Cloacimonadota bacterium]|nr:LysM peptidoglycan-binding domain-containing protein [Candidatus Cloacimonadota bacterium]
MILKYIIRKTDLIILLIFSLLTYEALFAATKQHKVKSGDTLYRISKKYNIPVDELKKINHLNTDALKLGQIILLEEKKTNEKKSKKQSVSNQTYKVKSGDNLSSIAKKHGLTVDELKSMNQMSSNKLSVGQELTVSKAIQAPENNEPVRIADQEEDNNVSVENTTYKVKKGDTLFRIAKAHQMNVEDLKKLNNITNNELKVGQVLLINKIKQPSSVSVQGSDSESKIIITHRVKKKETLASIAKLYGTSKGEIQKLNSLKSSRLKAGQVLKIQTAKPENEPQQSEPLRLNEKFHIVKKNQSLSAIAKLYQIDIIDLLDYNNLKDFDVREGQRIWLEPGHLAQAQESATPDDATPVQSIQSVSVHIVARGENLFRIAKNYNVSVDDLKKWNKLNTLTVKEGQRIYIGDASAMQAQKDIEFSKPNKQLVKSFSKTPVLPVDRPKVISNFGMRSGRMHKGIDFGAPTGEPIYAVLPGKVVFSGVQRGYGNVIILEHDNFQMTVYGHNDTNLVRVGDEVTQGQMIGTVGATGNANGSHLHFEYRVRGVAINPRDFLIGL